MVETTEIEMTSETNLFNSFGSSRIFATSLMPYMGIPSAANKAKYPAYTFEKLNKPTPSGSKTLAI